MISSYTTPNKLIIDCLNGMKSISKHQIRKEKVNMKKRIITMVILCIFIASVFPDKSVGNIRR